MKQPAIGMIENITKRRIMIVLWFPIIVLWDMGLMAVATFRSAKEAWNYRHDQVYEETTDIFEG